MIELNKYYNINCQEGLKAAKKLNRKFLGFEINREYCDIIKQRLSQEYLFCEK